jgi:hypothetical protein
MSNRTFKIKIHNKCKKKKVTFSCYHGEMREPRDRRKEPGDGEEMTVEKAPDSITLYVTPEYGGTTDNEINTGPDVSCRTTPIPNTDQWEVNVDYTGAKVKKDKKNHKISSNEAQTNVTVTDKQRRIKKPKKVV